MSEFVAYYNLCPIHDTKEFLGLAKDCKDGNIITTLGRNIIIIIKLSTQKQIRSWTVLDKLSSKVVYDQRSRQYVGVFANRYIRCWYEATQDINKLKKIKFQKNIADLISSENDETIILYSDGTCESLSSGIQSRKDPQNVQQSTDFQNQTIWDANLYITPSGQRMLTYFRKNQSTQEVELVSANLNAETLKPLGDMKKFKLSRREQNVNLAGQTVVEGQYAPLLLTIWSDKRIFIMPLRDDTNPDDAPGNYMSMINILNVDNPLSILGISQNCVAIYGANSVQEGASLILYNTQFKVVKAKQFFKIYFDFSRLWVVGSHILLAMGQNLSVVSFRVSKELLSEMIGSQISNDLQPYVGTDFINENDELEESLEFYSGKCLNGQEPLEEFPRKKNKKTPKADGKFIAYQPYEVFDEKFNLLNTQNIDVNIYQSEKDNEFQMQLSSNFYDSGFPSEEIELLAKELEKCGACEQEITEKILYVALQGDLIDDIAACFRRYTNISQKMLMKVLQYSLKSLSIEELDGSNEIHSNIQDDDEEEDIKFQSKPYPNVDILLSVPPKVSIKKKEDLLNLVLSCTIDVNSISTHLRKEINFNEALRLIKHLYKMFSQNDLSLEERPETGLDFDEDMKILQWFSIILNTHFQELALSRDTTLVDVLTKWTDTINLYKKDLNELGELSAVLYNLIEGKQIQKANKHSKWYSIEEIKLY